MELLNEKRQVVRLSRPLTRAGGEGQVFEIENSASHVAKVYHEPAEPAKAAKLRHQLQVQKPELRSIAAWPVDLLLDPKKPNVVRGIIMARVSGKEVHQLYGPSTRQTDFPAAGWDFLIHVAMNCAAAFETLHEHDVVMADVNEGNLLVDERDGRIGLIDCDSYQIRNGNGFFVCDVGIPMWTPPELQGLNYRGLQRTPNHDRFGLAVIIFRLLFMGRHPFAGIPTGKEQFEIQDAIRNFLFAFAQQSWSRGVKQPPHSLSLRAVPERLSHLFERAFLHGSIHPKARPTGREWAHELKALLSALKKGCIDPGHKFWNGLTSCPWCEIASAGGPNFFISVSVHLGIDHSAADFSNFWTTIERIVQGTLMREQVATPAIARATPQPMLLSKPQRPAVSVPIMPVKPAPPPRPIIGSPQLPARPTMRRPGKLPSIPMGPNESMARISILGSCFFGLFIVLCLNLKVLAAGIGAAWAFLACVVLSIVKLSRARAERRTRIDAERAARKEERRQAEEDHLQQLSEYEAQVEQLTQQHAETVARAEAEYQREWHRQDQDYQAQYNTYLAAKRKYDEAINRFQHDEERWNAECESRRLTEEHTRQQLMATLQNVRNLLDHHQAQVNAQFPGLDAARRKFEKAKADELADMRALHQHRQEIQLRQFLASQSIQNAKIPKIGQIKKATLVAYGIGSALDIRTNMQVPGIGDVLISNLLDWRAQCERQFRYNPNTPLPPAEVRAVKLKHAQTRQAALAELRGGAADLEKLESKTRTAVRHAKIEILELARAHTQALADSSVCS